MAQFKNYDRARNACSTEGLGALTIGDALTPGNSIKARMSTGDTAKFYYIKSPSQWISFLGTFTSPDQLARTRIIDGSSGPGVNVDFGAGAGEIGMDVPAEDLDALNLIPVPVTSAATTDIGALYGKIVAINGTTGPVTSYGATTINKERWVVHNGEQINHSAAIALIGSVNYLSSAGDVSFMKQDASSNWKEYVRTYADGRGPDGTVSLPGYSFTNDPDSGLYRIAANNIGWAVNGAKVLDVGVGGQDVTGDLTWTGAALAAYTPTITATTGTFTSVSASGVWKKFGKLIFFRVAITITTIGTAAGRMIVPFPTGTVSSSAGYAHVPAAMNHTTHKSVACHIYDATTALTVTLYDGTFPGTTGDTIHISGFYEID